MTDFGDIASYHSRIAARHLALAQAAREAGNKTEAESHLEQAARYVQAFHEQKVAMRSEPGPRAAGREQRNRPMKSSARPLFVVWLLAILLGVERMAAAARRFRSRRSNPVNGLSLR